MLDEPPLIVRMVVGGFHELVDCHFDTVLTPVVHELNRGVGLLFAIDDHADRLA